MADVTAINAIPWPELTDAPADIEQAVKPLAEHIDSRIVPRFTTTAARDTAIVTPITGQVAWVNSHGLMMYKTAWVPLPGTEVGFISNQEEQLIAEVTTTPLNMNTNDYLPWGGHSTTSNNSRFTPPFPGRYEFSGQVILSFALTGYLRLELQKNGVAIPGGRMQIQNSGIAAVQVTGSETFNGTTDYMQLFVYMDADAGDAGSRNTFTDFRRPTLRCKYLGPSF